MSVIVIGAGLPDASPPTIDSLRMGVDFGTSTLPMNPVGSLNSKTLAIESTPKTAPPVSHPLEVVADCANRHDAASVRFQESHPIALTLNIRPGIYVFPGSVTEG